MKIKIEGRSGRIAEYNVRPLTIRQRALSGLVEKTQIIIVLIIEDKDGMHYPKIDITASVAEADLLYASLQREMNRALDDNRPSVGSEPAGEQRNLW